MKAYKGFDKDLKCRDFQFEVGKEYQEERAKCCEAGFHACEYPLDVFNYYAPAGNRFCEVEMSGDIDKEEQADSKIAATRIRIGAEISLKAMIDAAIKFTFDRATWSKKNHVTEGRKAASATGDQGAASATGYRGAASATGYQGAASATGDQGAASATGPDSIACGLGWQCRAKAALGNWIVLAERDRNYNILTVKTALVDGEIIKADTYYALKGGEFVLWNAS